METVTIKYLGLYLNVTGEYTPGDFGDYETEPTPADFTADKITLSDEGVDLCEIIDHHIEDIELIVLNKLKD